MSFESLLINTCTIRRNTPGIADDYGQPTASWGDHLTGQACRLEASPALGGREIKVGAEVVIADYRLFIGDVDITERDRVIIDSITYEILLVEVYSDSVNAHHKTCWLRVVR